MKVIVCGAGQVGLTIAKQLAAERLDVTVIDLSPDVARRADENFDVRGIVGHAAHPQVLESAGARNADMLIAVTRDDEVNMVACQVAYSLFGVGRRIARVRHQGYLEPIWRGLYASDQLPIDAVISPELEVANGIVRRLKTPGAFDVAPLANGLVQLLGIHCNSASCTLVGRSLGDVSTLLPDVHVVPVGIVRNGRAFLPGLKDKVQPGDDLYVITQPRHVDAVMAFFGHREEVARRVVIVGGGNVGLSVARSLARTSPSTSLKIVEHGRERAAYVAGELGEAAVVLHGDALDREVLQEANVGAAETVIAVTNDDETNIFASVLAKNAGCHRAVTLVNKPSYEPLLPTLGIDAVVSPNSITISSILRHVRHRSVAALYSLREDFGEVIEVVAQPGSALVQGPLSRIDMPDGMRIGAIVRRGEVLGPSDGLSVEAGDHVVAMVTYAALRDAEALIEGTVHDPDA